MKCESFLCKIQDTCIYYPYCPKTCSWHDRCIACVLKDGCKTIKKQESEVVKNV